MQKIKKATGLLGLQVWLLAVVVFMLIVGSRCSNSRLPALQDISSGGDTLDVGIIYGPLSYYYYGDSLGGINFDILKLMEQQCSIPIKLKPVLEPEDTYKKLETGLYDLVASVSADYNIRQRFLTTESVFLDRLVLIQLQNEKGEKKVNSALDLAHDTVYVTKGSAAIGRIENLSKEIGDNIFVVELPDSSEEYLCSKVATGEIALAVVNEKIAKAMLSNYPLLSYDNPISFTQFQSWILNKNDSVRFDKINNWLLEFTSTPQYREIIEKY